MVNKSNLMEYALDYARKGIYIFPLNPKGKRVARRFGKISSSRDEETIMKWWGELPQLNIGISTSSYKNNIFVIDVDIKNGIDGVAELKRLIKNNDLVIPKTTIAKSGSGGYHLYFRNSNGKKVTCSDGGKLGIDVRGERAHIVVPPSVNKDGNTYEWYFGNLDSIAVATEDVYKLVDKVNLINSQHYVEMEENGIYDLIQKVSKNDSSLILFSSYSVGAGKTYEMLKYVKDKISCDNLVIGYINNLYREYKFESFDYHKYIDSCIAFETDVPYTISLNIDEIIQRKPQIVVIDELGYRNQYTGNRLYKDVIKLLSEGISVVATCNINILDVANRRIKNDHRISYKSAIPDFFLPLIDHIYYVDCCKSEIKNRYENGELFETKTRIINQYLSDDNLDYYYNLSLEVLNELFFGKYTIIKENN